MKKVRAQARRDIPSEEKLKAFAEEHLAYEIIMLQFAKQELSQVNHCQFKKSAFLECFTIHLRALIDFLWKQTDMRKDDAIASDFFTSATLWEKIRPEMPLDLEPARSRTNKEIAHLTYARMDVTSETKGWNFKKMTKAVLRVIKLFVDNADRPQIGKLGELLDRAFEE